MKLTPESMVQIDDPQRTSVLAYILKSLLENSLADPLVAQKAAKLNGTLGLYIGPMRLGLAFRRGEITILSHVPEKPNGWVKGNMAALVAFTRRKGLVKAALTGKLFAFGDPFFLLQMLALFKTR